MALKIALFVLLSSWSGETEQAADRHRHQLGWRSPSRQEVWSLWFLLRQWHRPGHPRAAQVSCSCCSLCLTVASFLISLLTSHCFRPGTTRGCYTSTSTSTMVMEWRRPSTPLTGSWLCPFTSMANTSLEPETWGCVCLLLRWLLPFHILTWTAFKWTLWYLQDIGAGKGKYYAVNYPLRDGIDDESYEAIFKPVSVFQRFHHIVKAIVVFELLMCFTVRSWLKSWRCTSQVQ